MRVINQELLDAAKRASDIINGVIASQPWEDIRNCCIAIRLSDGGWDGNIYQNKRDAVRHQLDEKLCAYVFFRNLGPSGCVPKELVHFLMWNRDAYKAGFRLPDPDMADGGPDLAPTSQQMDYYRYSTISEADIQQFRKQLGLV